MWMSFTFLLLCAALGGCTEKATTPQLMEFTAAEFYTKVSSGKMMFVYFESQVTPTISLFLEELAKSADVLQDYGVLVGKVNCNKGTVRTYCTDEKAARTAFLFRGGKEFLSFDLDTVFDVNSIVSEVLFAILRDEVKYVHTDADLLAMERAARFKKDIVLGYVQSLGTQEHRSIMETAYVYGSQYQFILITGGPVLKSLMVDESSDASQVWFLHCRQHSVSLTSEHCPMTRMRKSLSTLNLHSFLQLMEAPLVSDFYGQPSAVPLPQSPYQQTPQVFMFPRLATKVQDLETANALAWKLRGLALVVLVHRKEAPEGYNVAYRLPEKSSEVKYLTVHELDDLVELFSSQQAEQEDEDEDMATEEVSSQGKLDDEVQSTVYESRAHMLDLADFATLTSDNFHDMVAKSNLTVAVFYHRWDATAMVFMKAFVKVAERLADSTIQMTLVDCAEWTDLCAAEPGLPKPVPFQPVTVFPTVLLFRPDEAVAQHYRGLLSAEALYRFIMLSNQASPLRLSTTEEVSSFSKARTLSGFRVPKVLGLFKSKSDAGVSAFVQAAKSLRGEALTGLVTDALAEKWAKEHSLELPAVLVHPSWQRDPRPTVLPVSSSAEELLAAIEAALRHPLPELTVENLPTYLSLNKALLTLFVGDDEDEIGLKQNQALVEEMRGVLELGGKTMEQYLACWIHLGRTPEGMSVLGSHLGSMPTLPALVLSHLPSGDEIYQYPANKPIGATSVLQWIQRVEAGSETPVGMLGDSTWSPSFEILDFLKIMDSHYPDLAKQQVPEKKAEEMAKEEAKVEKIPSSASKPNIHTEL